MTTIQEKSKKLAVEHWDYVKQVIFISIPETATYDKTAVIEMCRFHFLEAWKHGAKHYAELIDGHGSQDTTKAKKAYDVKDWLSPAHINELLAGEID